MGFSKAMRSAQLMLACYLFMASATSECGGDESCVAAEKDAAALLQSTVNIHGGPSGKVEENEDDSNSKQSLLSPRTSEASGCTSIMDKEGCTESSSCSWNMNEAKCAVSCSIHKGKEQACKDAGYCTWMGGGQGNKCVDVTTLNIGGESSADEKQWHSSIAFRPEFATKQRYDDEKKKWEPCAGDSNCWYGEDHGGIPVNRGTTLKLAKSSDYTKAAMDVQLTCEITGTSKILVSYSHRENGEVQVTYNGESRETRRRKAKKGEYEIAMTSNDQSPILRVEFSKDCGRRRKCNGVVEVKIAVTNQPLWFENCMTTKSKHKQCLEVFANQKQDSALRTDHQKQKECINGKGTSDALCKAWYDCIDEDTRKMIVKVVDAFDPPALLLQENLLQGSTARPWEASDGCTEGKHPDCQDPRGIDVEAFDCNCYQVLKDKNIAEIRALACPASESQVCCHWKTANCGAPPSLLLQEGNEDTHSQKTMTSRSQQNNSENGDSLDDSLSGKRECA